MRKLLWSLLVIIIVISACAPALKQQTSRVRQSRYRLLGGNSYYDSPVELLPVQTGTVIWFKSYCQYCDEMMLELERLGKPTVGVGYGESAYTISQHIKKLGVTFPVVVADMGDSPANVVPYMICYYGAHPMYSWIGYTPLNEYWCDFPVESLVSK